MAKRQFFILFVVLALAAALRLANFSSAMPFSGDEGGDFLVAHHILLSGHRPLVGPFLSVTNFYTPPTYYYLLALFLALGKTPEGVVFFFFLMNLASLFILYAIAARLVDARTGVIAAFLFALSSVMVAHGKGAWQPHPVQFFLLLSLYLLLVAYKRRRAGFLWWTAASYGLATSIYPGPFLLAPYFLYQITRWYQTIRAKSFLVSLLFASATLLLAFLPWYIPQLFFEQQNSFPTAKALFSSAFGLPTAHLTGSALSLNILLLFNDFTSLETLNPSHFAWLVFPFILGFATLYAVGWFTAQLSPRAYRYRHVYAFIGLPWLLLGFLAIILYREAYYGHRLWAYFPFLFLLLALFIRQAQTVPNWSFRMLTGSLLYFYVLGNFATVKWWVFDHPRNDLSRTWAIARFVSQDLDRRNLSHDAVNLLLYQSGDYNNYHLPPVLYWLVKERNYPVEFVPAGNDFSRRKINNVTGQAVYLICERFAQFSDAQQRCLGKFLGQHQHYFLIQQKLFPEHTILFILQKETEGGS